VKCKKVFYFLNTCLKEGGVTAIMEAMHMGLPIVSVDTGGVTNIIPLLKVPLVNPKQVVARLSENILKLCQDKQLRIRVVNAYRKSIEAHTWYEKAKKIFALYKQATLHWTE